MATVNQGLVRTKEYAGIRARRILPITGPSSYTTGGDSFTSNDALLGLIEIFPSCVAADAAGANPRLIVYDYTNSKLLWFDMAGAEVGNGTDLSGYTFRVEVAGRG